MNEARIKGLALIGIGLEEKLKLFLGTGEKSHSHLLKTLYSIQEVREFPQIICSGNNWQQ